MRIYLRRTFFSVAIFCLSISCGPSYFRNDIYTQLMKDGCDLKETSLTQQCGDAIAKDFSIDVESFSNDPDELQILKESIHLLLITPIRFPKDGLFAGQVPFSDLKMRDFEKVFLSDPNANANQLVINYIGNITLGIRHHCSSNNVSNFDGLRINLCGVIGLVQHPLGQIDLAATLFHEARHAETLNHDIDCPNKTDLDLPADFPPECDKGFDKPHGWVMGLLWGLLNGQKQEPFAAPEQCAQTLYSHQHPSIQDIGSYFCHQLDYIYGNETIQNYRKLCRLYELSVVTQICEIPPAPNSFYPRPIQEVTIGNQQDGRRALGIFAADANGDGNLDVILDSYNVSDPIHNVDSKSHFLTIFPGNGDGSLAPGRVWSPSVPLHLASSTDSNRGDQKFLIGDLNNDRVPDVIAVGNFDTGDANITSWLNQGDGSLQNSKVTKTESFPLGVCKIVGTQLNHDQFLDLIVASCDDTVANIGTQLSIWLGRGDGTFMLGQVWSGGTEEYNTNFVVADLNQDGNMDIVPSTLDYFSILLGNGNGLFGAAGSIDNYQVFASPKHHLLLRASGDLNQDGAPDLLFEEGDQNVLVMLPGKGDGSFDTTKKVVTQQIMPIAFSALSDIDQDGKLDIISLPIYFGTAITVSFGKGNGAFSPARIIQPFQTYADQPFPAFHDFVLGDFNHDSKPDLAYFDYLTLAVDIAGNHP